MSAGQMPSPEVVKTVLDVLTKKKKRIIELLLWVLITVSISIKPFYALYMYDKGYYKEEYVIEVLPAVVNALIVILLPFLFYIIFRQMPLEFLVSKFGNVPILVDTVEDQKLSHNDENVEVSGYVKNDFLGFFAKESKDISEKIFDRSGAYLLIGCLIAILGVIIFYMPILFTTVEGSGKVVPVDMYKLLIDYLPRFGALFFVEFVALFFLKQYRIMLEEYRYYEAVKRRRQENMILVQIVNQYKDDKELLDKIIEKMSVSAEFGKLSSGESTQLVEIHKLLNQETDVMGKFIELIKEVKAK